jgi:hypothetical protein
MQGRDPHPSQQSITLMGTITSFGIRAKIPTRRQPLETTMRSIQQERLCTMKQVGSISIISQLQGMRYGGMQIRWAICGVLILMGIHS